MAGMGPKRQPDRTWVYPPIGAALEVVGLEEIGVYIYRRQKTVLQYNVTCNIMGLCLVEDQKPVMRLSRRWLEKPPLDIMGIIRCV